MQHQAIIRILKKYLRKGNMARCMRDILPSSNLTLEEREEVAKIIHDFVRFRRFYDFIIEEMNMEKRAENYLKILMDRDKYMKIAERIPDNKYFEIRYSLSPEVAEILKGYGEFLPIINREPDTHLCVNLIRGDRKMVIEKLRKEGLNAREYIPESSLITESRGRYSSVVRNNLAHVQDSSSQEISKIALSFGNRILDYCSGNGGKSLAMASLSKNTRDIYAHDVNERKLKILEERGREYGANIEIWNGEGDFDVVLVDAPCSGIGSAARNPEAKYQSNLGKYREIQIGILNEAKNYVAKNGYLIYSVCTFNPQETYGVVDEFLHQNGEFAMEDMEFREEYMRREKYGYFITLGDIIYFSVMRRER